MTESVIRNFSLADMDKRSVLHPATSIAAHLQQGPLIASAAKGVWVHDQDGRRLLDFGAGLWCVNVGYGRGELADAAATAIRDLSYFPLFFSGSNEPVIRLADRLLTLLHDEASATHLSKVFFGCSGSDANDTNIKLVRYYHNLRGQPQKKKVISRWGAYHGSTIASASLTGIAGYHKSFDLPIEGVVHTSCPHFYRFSEPGETEDVFVERIMADLEALIAREGPDTIGAFIAEPIMGTGGVVLPPKGYFEKLQAILQKHDILFLVDEVITGFGRVGSYFGTGLYGLKPDILTLAKGLTSGYFPLAASVISERIWDVLRNTSPEVGPFMHGFTYSGHPVGAAVALTNLDIIENEKIVDNSAEMGKYLLVRMRERLRDHPFVGDIRGQGLMMGVEFVADRTTRRPFSQGAYPHRLVQHHAAKRSLLIRALPFGDVTSLSPPLCITAEEIDEGVNRYVSALDAATSEMEQIAKRS